MMQPFFINSNLITEPTDIKTQQNYLRAIAYNIGNSYPTWSLIHQIYGCYTKPHHIQNIWTYDYSAQDKDLDFINNECSHVFLMLQDQIRIIEGYNQEIPFQKLINFIKKIKKELIVVGVGCNQYYKWNDETKQFIINNELEKDFCKKLNPQLIRFLQFLSDRTRLIGIRGSYTESVFYQLGIKNTQVIGCPSFYERKENRTVTKKPFQDIHNILILHPYNVFSADHSPLKLDFQGRNYNYNIQDEREFINVLFGTDITEINQEEISLLNQHKYHLFSAIEDWKRFTATHDMAFGYRIHGSILALNSGVPCLFTPPDIKGFEMAEFLKIPHNTALLSEKNIEKIYKSIDLDTLNKSYPTLYEKYVSFLAKHSVIINPQILPDCAQQPSLNLYRNRYFKKPSTFQRLKIRILSHLTWGDLKKNYKQKWHRIKQMK